MQPCYLSWIDDLQLREQAHSYGTTSWSSRDNGPVEARTSWTLQPQLGGWDDGPTIYHTATCGWIEDFETQSRWCLCCHLSQGRYMSQSFEPLVIVHWEEVGSCYCTWHTDLPTLTHCTSDSCNLTIVSAQIANPTPKNHLQIHTKFGTCLCIIYF